MFLGVRGRGGNGRLAVGVGIRATVGGHVDVGCRHAVSPTGSSVGVQQAGFALRQDGENLRSVRQTAGQGGLGAGAGRYGVGRREKGRLGRKRGLSKGGGEDEGEEG